MTSPPSTSTNTLDNVRHSARISIRKARKAEIQRIELTAASNIPMANNSPTKVNKRTIRNKLNVSTENKNDDTLKQTSTSSSIDKQNDHQVSILSDENLTKKQSPSNEIKENSNINENTSIQSINQPTENSKTSKLNSLVNKIYSRIFNFTNEEVIIAEKEDNTISASIMKYSDCESELFNSDEEIENEYFYKLMHLNNMASNAPNVHIYSTNKYDQVPFKVLQNTCIQCSKSFENSKWLKRHFIQEHFINKPTYSCNLCQNNEKEDAYFELDDYLSHLLSKHDMCCTHSNFVQLYDLFLLKMSQDFIIDYYITSNFKSVRNNSLVSELNLIIQTNFFNVQTDDLQNQEFVWSELINNIKKVTKSSLFKEICTYVNKDESKSTEYLNKNINDNEEYMQCSYCLKIFNKLNDFKLHLFNAHAYCNWINSYLSCSYCRQLIKVFGFKENMVDLMNKHILNEQCGSIKSDSMPIYNPCGIFFLKKGSENLKRKPSLDNSKVVDENLNKKTKLD